jgi:undecaprenyl-diphosphatase
MFVVLVALVALWRGRPRHAVIAFALVAGTALVTQGLKMALAHPRYQPILGSHQIPSGHSAGATAMTLILLLVTPRSWRPSIVAVGAFLVLSVSLSVVVLNLHYPSDVLAGYLVALGWCFALVAVGIVSRSPRQTRLEGDALLAEAR